jgi:hypothetical protein
LGLEAKYRKLTRQVGVFIEHPPVNWMTFFNFASAVLDGGTTFIFSLWVCVTNGAGSFCWHLVNDMKLEASAASQHSGLDEFIDNLDETLLPDLVRDIEEESLFNATSTRAAPVLLISDLIQSEELPFRLRNTATVCQKAMQFETLSALKGTWIACSRLETTVTTRKLPARIMLLLL